MGGTSKNPSRRESDSVTARGQMISGLAPIADMNEPCRHVAFVPRADMCVAANIGGSFDQSVGSKQERFWNREAHCLRSLQVNGQLEFGGLLDR